LFREPRPSNDFAAILVQEASEQQCELLLGCFMPDHLHALIRGTDEKSDVLEAFYRFKLRTGVLLDRFYRPAHWQKDFYDHIVRCDGDWRGQAKYVALNPVRKGTVEDPFDYPFNYSSLDTREEVLSQIFWDA
jgi:REP element-mobilizing transposase RayT